MRLGTIPSLEEERFILANRVVLFFAITSCIATVLLLLLMQYFNTKNGTLVDSLVFVISVAVPVILLSAETALSISGMLLSKRQWATGRTLIRASADNLMRSTLVPIAIPVLIRSRLDIQKALRAVEENWLMSNEADMLIVLLVDFSDTLTGNLPEDLMLRSELDFRIKQLNRSRTINGLSPASTLYRARLWNPYEQRWMGWERKRGKIVEFARLTQGLPTSFDAQCPAAYRGAQRIFVMDVDSRIRASDLITLEAIFLRTRDSSEEGRKPAILAPYVAALDVPEELVERYLCDPTVMRGKDGWQEPRIRQALFGTDIYHGKAILDVTQFLDLSKSFEDNRILSHDHIEAIFGLGCSTDAVSIYEPFPSSRLNWERRQHRWTRGDLQVFPYLANRDVLSEEYWSRTLQRLSLSHIILSAINPIFLYISIISVLDLGIHGAIWLTAFIAASPRDHLLPNIFKCMCLSIKVDEIKLRRAAQFLLLNGCLRTIGTVVFLQRNAIITLDAFVLTTFRLFRGRRGLLQWYPDNPDSVIVRRRLLETSLLVFAFIMIVCKNASPPILFCIIMWTAIPWILAKVSRIKRSSVSR